MIDLEPPYPLHRRITRSFLLILVAGLLALIVHTAAWFVLLVPAAIFLAGIAQALVSRKILFDRESDAILVVWKFLSHTFSRKSYRKSDFDILGVRGDSDSCYFTITLEGSTTLVLESGLTQEKVMPRAFQLKEILGLEMEGWGCVPLPHHIQKLSRRLH
jgi:hypothetical protein